MLTTSLDLVGLACLCVFGFLVWPPLAILVVGLGCLAASRATP